MKPLKSIALLTLLLSTTLSCAQWKKVKGNGEITTVSRSTSTYDEIKTAGSMDFNLVPGIEGEISIEGDSNLMEYIKTEVKNNKLIVKVKDGINLKPTRTIIITIPYKDISHVSLSGSGDVSNEGTIKADDFDVVLSGSGDINLLLSTKSVESNISGSGDISLSGNTKDLITKISGSGDFEGNNLDSKNVTAKITGSGDISVTCNGELYVRISGSGDVSYKGTPTKKDTKITGSGSVNN